MTWYDYFMPSLSVMTSYIANYFMIKFVFWQGLAGPHRAVRSLSDSRAGGPGLDTLSNHIIPFLFPLIQEVCARSTG